jgi:hypothetical protein
MNDVTHGEWQRALRITIDMLEAAVAGNWDRVSQLDAERQRSLRKRPVNPLSAEDRQIIAAMRNHNKTLMVYADAARATLKQQLDSHQYNRRALQTYIRSSSR